MNCIYSKHLYCTCSIYIYIYIYYSTGFAHQSFSNTLNFLIVSECPQAEDGMKLFACPTPDESGNFQCIDDHALCDRRRHCPNGEDEDRTVCMFHKMVSYKEKWLKLAFIIHFMIIFCIAVSC